MDLSVEIPEVVERMGPHPLTIYLIAESIFSHLQSPQDLLSCRQVAWPWRQMLTPMINSRIQELPRKTFSGSETEIENPNNSDTMDATPLLPKLTKYVKYLKEETEMEPKLLFSHFRFYNLPLEQPVFQEFLDQFGHTIRKLDLCAHGEPDYREFGNLPYDDHSRIGGRVESFWKFLSVQCNQLEDLRLAQVNFEPTNEDSFPSFCSKIRRLKFRYHYQEKLLRLQPLISNIFRNCHLLESLIVISCCPELFASALCESPHLSALKELTLGDTKVIQAWSENPARRENIQSNLRLKKLKIEHILNDEADVLNWFLETQKTSLETLIVGDWFLFSPDDFHILTEDEQAAIQNQPPQDAQFPFADVMEKLRELRISMDFDGPPLVFQPIDFQRQFPSLNKLILSGNASKLVMDSASESQPQLTLEGLHLPCGISQEQLRRAGEIFPNVKKLRVGRLGELAMRQLFSQWRQLESLFLKEFVGHDSILIGVSQTLLEAAEKIRVALGKEVDPHKVSPSITNFKYLKELRLSSAQPLTDLSLRYAISKMKTLEFLAVKGQKFSEEGIKKLLSSIPHLQLCEDEGNKWRKLGFQLYQKDLSKEYNAIPIIDEEFGRYED